MEWHRKFKNEKHHILADRYRCIGGCHSASANKPARLQGTITEWEGLRLCTHWEVLSLIGQLLRTSNLVRPGRSSLRRMITST